ncbi:hypothetical protein ACFOZ7_22330 [Natribaculum luteum]|uniref:Uncharacterized protein n=1 Tax=Natribaculum luteum TaxID=1586232 RepID=A0ABD5P679_9EURY|nr:hypothetical protein [Natribaculum luteum]
MTTNDEMSYEDLKERVRKQQARDPNWPEYPADEYPSEVMLMGGGWLEIEDEEMHRMLAEHRECGWDDEE